jgi:hypothetical protein
MSVIARCNIASVMIDPSYVNAVQGYKFQDIRVSAEGGGATLALRNGFRPAAGERDQGRQGVPVKMHTMLAGPLRHRSSVFSACAQLA